MFPKRVILKIYKYFKNIYEKTLTKPKVIENITNQEIQFLNNITQSVFSRSCRHKLLINTY